MIDTTTGVTVELLNYMGGDDSVIQSMLVSTMGRESMDASASEGRINFLMRNKHGTPFEHNAMTFFVAAPIFVFREFHRHRIGFSYNEMSGRYKELPAKFYLPGPDRPLIQVGKPGEYRMEPEPDEQKYLDTIRDLLDAYDFAYEAYQRIIARGHAKEIARACLPVAIFSEMYVTCNARSLMSFLSLRVDDPAATFPSKPQWEIQLVAKQMEAVFAGAFPLTHASYLANGRVAP